MPDATTIDTAYFKERINTAILQVSATGVPVTIEPKELPDISRGHLATLADNAVRAANQSGVNVRKAWRDWHLIILPPTKTAAEVAEEKARAAKQELRVSRQEELAVKRRVHVRRDQAIRAHRLAGMPISQLARKFGLSPERIYKITGDQYIGNANEQLADNLEDIEAALARVPSNYTEWVKVTARLPEKKSWVLVADTARRVIEAQYRGGDEWWTRADDDLADVTHWMPLPAHPKASRGALMGTKIEKGTGNVFFDIGLHCERKAKR